MILLAVFIPGLAMLIQGRVGAFVLCLLLQISIIGYCLAIVIAVNYTHNYHRTQQTRRILNAINR